MIKKGNIKFGDIFLADFDPSLGHEFQSKRPAIIIQSDGKLAISNLVTVIPLTANKRNKMVDDIDITPDSRNYLPLDSLVKVYDIVSFDYSRFIKKIGVANNEIMDKIKIYLKKHFGIINI